MVGIDLQFVESPAMYLKSLLPDLVLGHGNQHLHEAVAALAAEGPGICPKRPRRKNVMTLYVQSLEEAQWTAPVC